MRAPRPQSASATLVAVALVIAAMASVQTGAAIAKQLFPVVGPLGAAALRLLFATILLGVVLRPWRVRVTRRSWRPVLVYGIALGGMNSLFYASIRSIPLGIATAFELTGPLVLAMLSSRRGVDFVWIGLAVGGVLLLLPVRQAAGGVDPVGAAFAFGAGACWALYILFGQRAGAEHGVQTTGVGMVIAATCVLPFGVAHAGAALFTPRILPYAVAVALLSNAVPYSLEMVALGRLARKTFGTLMSLQPAFAAMSGLVFLHERLGPAQWIAVAAIMLASAGATATAARGAQAALATDAIAGADPVSP